MRYFLPVFIACAVAAPTLPTLTNGHLSKKSPDYQGTAQELIAYESAYRLFAAAHHITFTKHVNMGFAYIKAHDKSGGEYVGFCNYSNGFREIDIDKPYWDELSPICREALVFHEMTHCYCNRNHDWGVGVPYPDAGSWLEKLMILTVQKLPNPSMIGYMSDKCPDSLMYPHVLTDECMLKHRKQYLDEMFERCKPY